MNKNYLKTAINYFEIYIENMGPDNVATTLLNKCKLELGEKIEKKANAEFVEKFESRQDRHETYLYGFRGDLFLEVLQKYAHTKNPDADEDTIWGHDVPIFLCEMYEQMTNGNRTVC